MTDTFRSEDSGNRRQRDDPCSSGHDYVKQRSWTEEETRSVSDPSEEAFFSGERYRTEKMDVRVTSYRCSRCNDTITKRESSGRWG